MSELPPFAESPSPHDGGADRALAPDEVEALLRASFDQYTSRLFEATRASLEMAGDLFESTTVVPDGEIASFQAKRGEWSSASSARSTESFDQWRQGRRRRGRRPDTDASAATLSVLTPFDQEKQAALVEATAFLHRFTQARARRARRARRRAGAVRPAREQRQSLRPRRTSWTRSARRRVACIRIRACGGR